MKTLIQRPLFLILLLSAVFILPACGSKGTVKSDTVSETVLNPSSTNTAEPPIATAPVKSYVQKIHHRKAVKHAAVPVAPVTTLAPTPAAPAQNIPVKTPAMETAVPLKKGGSHWFLWLLLIVILAAIGWYFWSKKQNEGPHPPSSQPMPPVGGVSPVSGFMALKDRIEDEPESKPSFWTKKLF